MRIYSYPWLPILLFMALTTTPSNASSPLHRSAKELPGIRLPNHPQSLMADDDDTPSCNQFQPQYGENPERKINSSSMQVKLLHHHHRDQNRHKTKTTLLLESLARDQSRIHSLHQRKSSATPTHPTTTTYSKNPPQNPNQKEEKKNEKGVKSEVLVADVESGVSVGSGEYFVDAFIGTPPRHFQLIVDTGSDLNWVQCLPCHDCYPQEGPLFNPSLSSSYRPLPCSADECSLVETGAAGQNCTNSSSSSCSYFYWYGDRSNTTGDLAVETFTVNVSGAAKTLPVEGVVFGCGHANRGLFHGSAGLLGLGRGQLSFAAQLRRRHGHKFSYCLVDRDSDLSVTSKLVFGDDRRLTAHPDYRSTAFLPGGATFYYLNLSAVTVGADRLEVPPEISEVAGGGVIIDSGTTLTYLAEPAYGAVKAAFESKIPYARGDFSPLDLCYNVSGVAPAEVKLPEFAFHFGDGATWKFPAENYFIQPDPQESVVCLAVLMTSAGSLSILGNYQQQNFHVMYDVEGSRLGFAPMACADV